MVVDSKEYIDYVISKMDLPRHSEYPGNATSYIQLDSNIFSIANLSRLLDTDKFRQEFDKFAELQTIIYNKEIDVKKPKYYLTGIIKLTTELSSIFICCDMVQGIVLFKELYSKRCKKIVGHIMLEGKFDELIYHLEERVLDDM